MVCDRRGSRRFGGGHFPGGCRCGAGIGEAHHQVDDRGGGRRLALGAARGGEAGDESVHLGDPGAAGPDVGPQSLSVRNRAGVGAFQPAKGRVDLGGQNHTGGHALAFENGADARLLRHRDGGRRVRPDVQRARRDSHPGDRAAPGSAQDEHGSHGRHPARLRHHISMDTGCKLLQTTRLTAVASGVASRQAATGFQVVADVDFSLLDLPREDRHRTRRRICARRWHGTSASTPARRTGCARPRISTSIR